MKTDNFSLTFYAAVGGGMEFNMKNKINSISDKPSLLKMTWPIFIEYAMAMFVGNIDQIMISKYSENSVIAIGNSNSVLNLLILTFTIISLSTTILVSQHIGAKKEDKIGEIYTLAVFVNGAFGILISAVLVLFAKHIAVFIKVTPLLHDEFIKYISIVGGFMFLQALFTTFASIFKSNAYMKEVMTLSIAINAVNILFNYLLIYGIGPFPELGIVGVAIATVLGRLTGVVLIIVMYFRKIRVSLSFKQLKPFPKRMLGKMVTIGLPAGGESVSYSITALVILVMINTFGIVEAKTKMYASMFASVTWMFASAVSQAAQILVGYHKGAGDIEGVQKQVKTTLKFAVTASASIATLLFIFNKPLFGLVTIDPDVIKLGSKILIIDIFLESGRAVNITMVRSLQAAGDTKFPIMLGIISTWIIAVGLSYLLGVVCGLGLIGVWIAMASDECTRAIIFIFRWKSGKWKTKDLLS